jgi:ATP-dependent Clp protease protease subunit
MGGMNNYLPYVIETTGRGERSYDIYSRLLSDRILFLGEEVTEASAAVLTAQLLYLEGQDPEKDISLYINSPGGSVTAGLAIYDTMQYIHCDVSTVCIGMAASMGAFLLAGGTKGKRFSLPHAEIMIHQPAIHGNGLQGQVSDIEIMAKHLKRNKERLNWILCQNTGQSLENIQKDTERDHFMTAEEAFQYGLIDKVISSRN